jgi:hypothetical protein
MRRAAALVAAFGVLAAGCGGNGEPPAAATDVETKPAKSTTPAGYTVRSVKDQGFAVALPKSWRSLDAKDVLASGTMKQFERSNPQLKGQVEALAKPDSPLKLLATGPIGKDGFLTNLNVIVTQLPPDLEFDEWTKAELAEIQKVPTVKDVEQEVTQLPPGKTLHLNYHATFNKPSGPFEVVVNQWMLKKDDFLYILTYTTSPSQEAKLQQTFDDSAHTFELTG